MKGADGQSDGKVQRDVLASVVCTRYQKRAQILMLRMGFEPASLDMRISGQFSHLDQHWKELPCSKVVQQD